jgi:hypothetical protein
MSSTPSITPQLVKQSDYATRPAQSITPFTQISPLPATVTPAAQSAVVAEARPAVVRPARSAAPAIKEPLSLNADNGSKPEDEDEEVEQKLRKLSSSIAFLWSSQKKEAKNARKTKEEARHIRLALGQQLYELKTIYVKAGRNGKWSSYLSGAGISKATADRYVERHKQRITPPVSNLLNEETSEPTAELIAAKVKKLIPQLKVFLTAHASVTQFIEVLSASLGETA